MAHLEAESGPLTGQVFPIDPGLTAGRAPHNTIAMPENRKASRDHCKVWKEGPNSVAVADLGSTNGTLVNGERVARTTLKDGDRLQVGDAVFLFRLDEAEKPKAVAKPPASRPDLADVLGGRAPSRPAPEGVSAKDAASLEIKQRVLQYSKKSRRGTALGWSWDQLAGPVKWGLILVVLGAAVGLFFLAKNMAVSSRTPEPPVSEEPLD